MWCSDDITAYFILDICWPVVALAALAFLSTRMIPTDDEAVPQPDESLMEPPRQIEDFKRGLWNGKRAKMPSRLFQLSWPYMVRIVFTEVLSSSHVVRGAFALFFQWGFWIIIVLTFVRVSPMLLHKVQFHTMGRYFSQIEECTETLNFIVGFLFSFYVLGRVGWWWQVMLAGRIIQGRSHDIAMLVGGFAATEDHHDPHDAGQEKWWDAKWHLYRYLMLGFIVCFRPVSPTIGKIDNERLIRLGFLERDEELMIRKSLNPRKVVLKWLTMWVSAHINDQYTRSLILDKVCGLRGAMGTLHDTIEQRAPWSFEALLHLLVRLYVLLLPFRSINETTDRLLILESSPVLPTLNSMLVCAFYEAMMLLLEYFKYPFGVHSDAMHVETILLETETSIVDYLTAPSPESLQEWCKDELPFEEEEGNDSDPLGVVPPTPSLRMRVERCGFDNADGVEVRNPTKPRGSVIQRHV